jgi:hypothetical protein
MAPPPLAWACAGTDNPKINTVKPRNRFIMPTLSAETSSGLISVSAISVPDTASGMIRYLF